MVFERVQRVEVSPPLRIAEAEFLLRLEAMNLVRRLNVIAFAPRVVLGLFCLICRRKPGEDVGNVVAELVTYNVLEAIRIRS